MQLRAQQVSVQLRAFSLPVFCRRRGWTACARHCRLHAGTALLSRTQQHYPSSTAAASVADSARLRRPRRVVSLSSFSPSSVAERRKELESSRVHSFARLHSLPSRPIRSQLLLASRLCPQASRSGGWSYCSCLYQKPRVERMYVLTHFQTSNPSLLTCQHQVDSY